MVKKLVEKYQLHHYKNFVYTDAGRWEYLQGKSTLATLTPKKRGDRLSAQGKTNKISHKAREVGDCAVRVLALVCDVPYAEVRRIARRHGWSKYRGWMDFAKFLNTHTAFGTDFEHIRTWGRGMTTTTFEFLEKNPQGTFVLLTKQFGLAGCHTFMVKNGRIFDTYFDDAWVLHAFRVLDK